MNTFQTVFAAIACFGFGLYSLYDTFYKKKHNTVETTGKVVDVIKRRHRSAVSYFPVVEYHVMGKDFCSKADVSSSFKRKYKVGDEIKILYDPEDPETISIKGRTFLFGIILALFFFFLTGLCIYDLIGGI